MWVAWYESAAHDTRIRAGIRRHGRRSTRDRDHRTRGDRQDSRRHAAGRQDLRGGWGRRCWDAEYAHTRASVEKMRRGEPLTDADRAPWLDRVRALAIDVLDA